MNVCGSRGNYGRCAVQPRSENINHSHLLKSEFRSRNHNSIQISIIIQRCPRNDCMTCIRLSTLCRNLIYPVALRASWPTSPTVDRSLLHSWSAYQQVLIHSIKTEDRLAYYFDRPADGHSEPLPVVVEAERQNSLRPEIHLQILVAWNMKFGSDGNK